MGERRRKENEREKEKGGRLIGTIATIVSLKGRRKEGEGGKGLSWRRESDRSEVLWFQGEENIACLAPGMVC